MVSILINNYNYARFVGEAIDSALQQDYPQVEVVVVDDGSTDDSREIIMRYGDRVRCVFQRNSGQAAAFNAGFAESSGEIICLLDADDRFTADKAKVVADIYEGHPTAGWVFHPLTLFGTDRQLAGEAPAGRDDFVDARSDAASGRLKVATPATSGLTFRRSLLGRLLPMPVEIRITSDNYLKLAALGLTPGVLAGRSLAEQRIHGANAYTLNPRVSSLRGEIAMMTAHHLRRAFPELKRLAHGVYARGFTQWLGSAPRGDDGVRLARQYVSGLGPFEFTEVAARSALNLVRRMGRS